MTILPPQKRSIYKPGHQILTIDDMDEFKISKFKQEYEDFYSYQESFEDVFFSQEEINQMKFIKPNVIFKRKYYAKDDLIQGVNSMLTYVISKKLINLKMRAAEARIDKYLFDKQKQTNNSVV
jgi:hypothetical protein